MQSEMINPFDAVLMSFIHGHIHRGEAWPSVGLRKADRKRYFRNVRGGSKKYLLTTFPLINQLSSKGPTCVVCWL